MNLDPKLKKNLFLGLRIFVSIALIAFLIWWQDFTQIVKYISTFNPLFFIATVLLALSRNFLGAVRWQLILKAAGKDEKVSVLNSLYLKGYFYNNFLPTQLGGDVYKSVALGRRLNDQSTSLFSVFMDRFSGLVVLLVLSLFGIASTQGALGVAICLFILIIGLALYKPVLNFAASKIKFLVKFKEASDMLIKDKRRAGQILFYSLFIQMVSFSIVYIFFLGLHPLPMWAVFAYLPVTSLAIMIPFPSFNGLGSQELIYTVLFATVGVTPEISTAASVLVHINRLVLSLIGGGLVLFNKQ